MENSKGFKFQPQAFYRRIDVSEKLGQPVIESLFWGNMRIDTVIKWDWYFKYRAALLQVKYPRYRVELQMWSKEPTGLTKQQIEDKNLRNRITTCKRMVTKLTNAIDLYEKEESLKLIPDWEYPNYLKVKAKREKYQNELNLLNNKVNLKTV